MADPLRPSGPQIPGSLMGEIQSEVAVEATPLLSFVLRNSRIIVACIVLLVLVIVGVGGWQWHQGRVEREAHLELGRILVAACLQDLLHPLSGQEAALHGPDPGGDGQVIGVFDML